MRTFLLFNLLTAQCYNNLRSSQQFMFKFLICHVTAFNSYVAKLIRTETATNRMTTLNHT